MRGLAAGLVLAIAILAGGVHAQSPKLEGQRQADQNNGTYLNPILAGDHPDPTILKDGDTYYATFSTFESYPGLLVWSSKDLINWQPIAPALTQYLGSVWAPCLVKYKGRYLIYFPARSDAKRSNYVVWADHIEGPWSAPIDLNLPKHIDPGFAVGEDGKPYLFLSGGDRIALSDDGLATRGDVQHVAEPFVYPEDWDVESQSVEGPKITRHGDYFYIIWAEGGTAGPPTGHMVVVARSHSINGPWQLDPHNPIIRTQSKDEPWWSKGHGSLVETPDGWFMVYHGYENGYMTLGRQMLMEPVVWTDDGWFKVEPRDLAKPIKAPFSYDPYHVPSGIAQSDDFASNDLGLRWSFYKGASDEGRRAQFGKGLTLTAKGDTPRTSSPLLEVAPDQAYEVETELTLTAGATAGVVLYYSDNLYVGLGLSQDKLIMHRYGTERPGNKPAGISDHIYIRMRNNHNIVSFYTSPDGQTWTKYGVEMEVSGYNHNVGGGFLSLKPGIYVAGTGAATFAYWTYRALP